MMAPSTLLALLLLAQSPPSTTQPAQPANPAPRAAAPDVTQPKLGPRYTTQPFSASPAKSGVGSIGGSTGTAGSESPTATTPGTITPSKIVPGQALGSGGNAAAGSTAAGPAGLDANIPPGNIAPGNVAGQGGTPGSDDAQDDLIPVHPAGTEPAAEQLLRFAPASPPTQEPQSAPTPLLTVLTVSQPVGAQRLQGIEGYWQLFVRVVEQRFTEDEHQKLLAATSGVPSDNPEIQAALTASAARQVAANLALLTAQHDLADELGQALDAPLPWPSDRPLVGPYRTYYETLFAGRAAVAPSEQRRARRIHETLPVGLQAIRAYAVAAAAAENLWAAKLQAAVGQGMAIDELLDCHAELRRQRRAFLNAVRDYNFAIAEYAMLAAPSGSSPGDLLPMLIKVSPRTATPPRTIPQQPLGTTRPLNPVAPPGPTLAVPPTASSPVVQAGTEEPIDDPQAQPPEPRRLRSVVVPSRPRP